MEHEEILLSYSLVQKKPRDSRLIRMELPRSLLIGRRAGIGHEEMVTLALGDLVIVFHLHGEDACVCVCVFGWHTWPALRGGRVVLRHGAGVLAHADDEAVWSVC